MMAKGVLKSFGVSKEEFPALVQDWKKIPGSKSMRFRLSISLYEYEQMQSKLDRPLQKVFQDFLDKKKEELLKK